MTEKQEILLKEIEELGEKFYQGLSERKEEISKLYDEKKIEIERRRLENEGKKSIFPIKRITELSEEIKEERERENYNKAVKERMLEDLSSWALDPEGFFHRVDGRRLKCTWNHGVVCLSKSGKHRDEVVNAFIEEIKQNPQDWKIIKGVEPIVNGIPFNYGTDYSAVEHKSGRKHYKPDFIQIVSFSDEERAEIENALNHNEQFIKNTEIKKENEFQDLSWEELTKEIKTQKAEIEELKTNQNISNSEKQIELQKREEKLKKLEKVKSTQKTKSGNKFPTGLAIGGGIVTLAVLAALALAKRNNRKKKI